MRLISYGSAEASERHSQQLLLVLLIAAFSPVVRLLSFGEDLILGVLGLLVT
jgi:hypothetical protein